MKSIDFSIFKEAKEEQNLSMAQIKKMPPAVLLRMINKAKKILKNDNTWKEACKEYDEEVDIIDFIPVKFGKLDVSAKTDHAVVILNYKLLISDDIQKNICQYLLHESTHYLQQTCGTKPTKSSDDGNYLKNPFEQEAFTNQVSFIGDNFGEEEAEDYVEDLLEYHEVDNKKDKKKIEDKLLSKL